jgi:ATP-dependent Clp protease ATP-binding subunit ClpC
LFLFLVGSTNLKFTFSKFLLNQGRVFEVTEDFWKKSGLDATDSLKEAEKTIGDSLKLALSQNESKISIFHLLHTLIDHDIFVEKILLKSNIAKSDILDVLLWQERIQRKERRKKKFWLKSNLLKKRSIAKNIASGYTPFLDLYSKDITEIIKSSNLSEIVLHKNEISEVENGLVQSAENCVVLVGEKGVGKKTIIINLADKMSEGKTFSVLNYDRIIEVDMPSLLAASGDDQELEVNLQQLFTEATNAGNVIVVISDIHNYLGSNFDEKAISKIDISGMLSQYISYPAFRLIATTTPDNYHRLLNQSNDIASRFVKVEVSPANSSETLKVIEELVLDIEKETKFLVTFPALKEIVMLCDRYIGEDFFPHKAVDLLNEVIVYKLKNIGSIANVVQSEDVSDYVSQKIEIPVGEATNKEKQALLNMEKLMHQHLIDQEEAVSEIANALRRARTDIGTKKRNIGNFLFLGPTGVGKTETAKSLARVYFGNEKRMIRLDMSEFQDIASISRLIGDDVEPGHFTTMVRQDPFSLILLDEIEKAHPNILNLFLQILDEGHLTDGAGRLVDFKNTIIIATSNAGSELIRNAIKEEKNLTEYKEEFIDEILQKEIFRAEFLNRFDGIILFRTLSQEHLEKIASLMLEGIKKELKNKDIDFLVTPGLIKKIAQLGFDPEFGAREMRRVIQNTVENNLAKALLAGTMKSRDVIEVDPSTFEIKILEGAQEFP